MNTTIAVMKEAYDDLKNRCIFLKQQWDETSKALYNAEKEIERLQKSQVVWRKLNGMHKDFVAKTYNDDGDFYVVEVVYDGFACTIPLPPAEVDHAEKAWEYYTEKFSALDGHAKEDFIAGFRAAQAKSKEAA